MNDWTDDELFAELNDESTGIALHTLPAINFLDDRQESNKRLTKCFNCPYNKNLICEKNSTLINVLARSKDASCPIGEW